MARPQTNKVDYFPHPVSHGKKMSFLEKKYGNNGYATWFKILEELGNTDYHYLDLSDEVQIMFLSDRCLVSEDVLLSIINDLIRLKEFDKRLWDENFILFNEKYVESIKDAYSKRINNCINKKSLLILLDSLGIRKLSKSKHKPSLITNNTPINPQSKVEYSKVDKTKVDEVLEDINADVILINEDCKKKYLKDQRLVDAIIANKANKIRNTEHLQERVNAFNKHLTETGVHQKKWKDYASHFRYWNLSNKTSTTGKSPTDISL